MHALIQFCIEKIFLCMQIRINIFNNVSLQYLHVYIYIHISSTFMFIHEDINICEIYAATYIKSLVKVRSVVYLYHTLLYIKEPCEGRRREALGNFIQFLQDAVSAPETCCVPVIAAISGHCIGLLCSVYVRT
jgi:hypothetical protein